MGDVGWRSLNEESDFMSGNALWSLAYSIDLCVGVDGFGLRY